MERHLQKVAVGPDGFVMLDDDLDESVLGPRRRLDTQGSAGKENRERLPHKPRFGPKDITLQLVSLDDNLVHKANAEIRESIREKDSKAKWKARVADHERERKRLAKVEDPISSR